MNNWIRNNNGELMLADIPLSTHVQRVGKTPCYLYDRSKLSERVQSLRSVLHPGIHIHYAMKANPMPALVCHMAQCVDGLDVASAGELHVAMDTGMSASEISFAGPGKTESELSQAVAAGVLINVESFREVRLLAAICESTGHIGRVAVRVNPAFELRSSGMKMGGGPKQFGVDSEQVPALLNEIDDAGLQFEGFHLFTGSQNLKAEVIIDSQQKCYALARELASGSAQPVRKINIGGGFGIPYFKGEQALDMSSIIDNLNDLAEQQQADFPDAGLIIELGRYLVGEAGIYVSRVLDRKPSRGYVYLITDGGMHHHLAASGNFGQVIRKNYPVALNKTSDDVETVTVVGPLCTPLDLLADKVELPAAEPDDLFIVFQSGAYGRSSSPRGFLSHPDVLEVLV